MGISSNSAKESSSANSAIVGSNNQNQIDILSKGMQDIIDGDLDVWLAYKELLTKREVPESNKYLRIEPRTRKANNTFALSMPTYDPLWTLARQWQFGEFQGNDCGSAILAKVEMKKRFFSSVKFNRESINWADYAKQDEVLEYRVERMDHRITPIIRIESALHFKRMLRNLKLPNEEKLHKEKEQLLKNIMERFPLDNFAADKDKLNPQNFAETNGEEMLDAAKKDYNKKLEQYWEVYGNRIFDGYKLFKESTRTDQNRWKPNLKTQIDLSEERIAEILKNYCEWFKERYLPSQLNKGDSCWSDEQLGYDVAVQSVTETGQKNYSVKDYHSGRLSWYSFDEETEFDEKSKIESTLPLVSKETSTFGSAILGEKNLDSKVMEEEMALKNKVIAKGADSNYNAIVGKENLNSNIYSRPNEPVVTKRMTFIPVPATFPGAPNKRLWEMEDANVSMGNINLDYNSVANAAVLQYTTMYGNDWMLLPMELEVGTLMDVVKITVTDTFGEKIEINKPTSDEWDEGKKKDTAFTNRWDMFGIARADAYTSRNFEVDRQLFYPPSLARTVESKPIETIQFLRDEMSNMLWGVEKVIEDGCGGTFSGDSFAANVISTVDDIQKGIIENKQQKAIEQKKQEIETKRKSGKLSEAEANKQIAEAEKMFSETEKNESDYKFVLQNRVPLNWIPFIPQKYEVGSKNYEREIRFRRATMPLYLNNGYERIRPNTMLLETKKDSNNKVIPHYVNEEEILSVGTKVSLNYQRTRWFNGKTFNWLGAKKEVSETMGNSGLQQDELIQKISAKDFRIDKTN